MCCGIKEKRLGLFYCYQCIVNRHSVEVQTFHAYFLRGKSLKHPTLYQVETIYKKMVCG